MRILIVTGGTGGHIYPGIAVAARLIEKSWEVIFVGPDKKQVRKIVERAGFKFYPICSIGMPRKVSLRFFLFFIKLIYGFFQAIRILTGNRPHLILGMGGYVCPPVIFAAKFYRLPVILHEPNVMVGLANRFLSGIVDKVLIGFKGSMQFFSAKKAIYAGVPVRREILFTDRNRAITRLFLKGDRFSVFIFGGSLGAHVLNSVSMGMLEFLQSLKEKIQFIHITGPKDFNVVKKEYQSGCFCSYIVPYMDNIADAYVLADLIISRAGAVTVSEIIAQGKPSILIPYPHATAKHQEMNARYLSERNASILIEEADLNSFVLAKTVSDLFLHKEKLKKLSDACEKISKPDATNEFVRVIESLV